MNSSVSTLPLRVNESHDVVGQTIRSMRTPLKWAALFSGAINIMLLVPTLFMLQVYDRVLPSQSIPTLQALLILVGLLYGLHACLDVVRGNIFSRMGRLFNEKLAWVTFQINVRNKLEGPAGVSSPLKDLERIREFMASGGPSVFFDIPWAPIYVFTLFVLHPYLGILGSAGAVALIFLAWVTHRSTKPLQQKYSLAVSDSNNLAETSRRNAETLTALGMLDAIFSKWNAMYRQASQSGMNAADVISRYSGYGKFLRLLLQSLVLAIGAWLVINEEATPGIMIAASLLQGRALFPIEQAIARWSSFSDATQSFHRLNGQLSRKSKNDEQRITLPHPKSNIVVDNLVVIPPGTRTPTVRGIRFNLEPGDILGVIGASGAGKSTLVRCLVGVWPAAAGSIRFDGSSIDQWTCADASKFIGYLPQTVELFSGTIGENISRFDESASGEDILAAANDAGIDLMVRSMPQGFDTQVGDGGEYLSAGQRQRIGLARALYKQPFMVILDEPNSALDAEGEIALAQCLQKIKMRRGIVILISHRPIALKSADKLLSLSNGQQRDYGAANDVLKRLNESFMSRSERSI